MNGLIAQFALNLAVIIYVVQLLPQLWRTASNDTVTDLSMTMIWLLWLGWVMDVLYAKLHNMPTQYFIVSYLGLLQTMAWVYMLFTRQSIALKELGVAIFFVLCLLLSPLKWIMKLKFIPVLSIGQMCFWVCWLSQLVHSFIQKSAKDISLLSLLLGGLGTICSLTAGTILGWEKQYLTNLVGILLFHFVIVVMLAYLRFYKGRTFFKH